MSASEKERQAFDQVCFYWDERVKTCRSSAGGLFLPVQEHIVTYCRTVRHTACVYYRDVVPETLIAPDTGHDDRRRFSRVVGRYPFQISDVAINRDTMQQITIYASTVDFSLGGIRFETDHLVPVDTLVEFSLTGSYTNVVMNGIGRVKWCRSRQESTHFHVGVAFTEKMTDAGMISNDA